MRPSNIRKRHLTTRPGTISQGVQANYMTSMFTRILVIGAMLSSLVAVAQTGSAALPAAPSSAASSAAEPPVATGNKVATINITGALAGCNEGQRDFGTLDKKFEPRQTELTNNLGT